MPLTRFLLAALALPCALAALAAPARAEAGWGFDRVDIVSEDPGTWLNYELPVAGTYPTRAALRFVTQIRPVWTTPIEGLTFGTSIQSQSLSYERPLPFLPQLHWNVTLQTRLLLPRGVNAGLAWRWKWFRIGAGVSASTAASWSAIDYRAWNVLPVLGIGVGRDVSGE